MRLKIFIEPMGSFDKVIIHFLLSDKLSPKFRGKSLEWVIAKINLSLEGGNSLLEVDSKSKHVYPLLLHPFA